MSKDYVLSEQRTAHTPGPWLVRQPHANSLPHIMSQDGIYVMDAPPRNSGARARVRQLADARLIAAAPELFTALVAFEHEISGRFGSDEDMSAELRAVVFYARAAIAKAKGAV